MYPRHAVGRTAPAAASRTCTSAAPLPRRTSSRTPSIPAPRGLNYSSTQFSLVLTFLSSRQVFLYQLDFSRHSASLPRAPNHPASGDSLLFVCTATLRRHLRFSRLL